MSIFKLMTTVLGVIAVAMASCCAWQIVAEAVAREDISSVKKFTAGLSAALVCSAVLGGSLEQILTRLFPR